MSSSESVPTSFVSHRAPTSAPFPSNAPESDNVGPNYESLGSWAEVLPRIINAVVSIKGTSMRAFDTEGASVYEGTGFVVDRTRGIILSNRHVVKPGPVSATAVFSNYEEVSLTQDYYDPVHDFGFFRYDPAKIKFAEVEEIELNPQGAKVGLDIKVCGNDAGEKLSIASSTLSRIDRRAPMYSGRYCDFNINYFQAASGTSGGSSGSPVLDLKGRAIALNAGGRSDSATAFFLPLDPIVRALKLIQEGKKVPRGTIQTEFILSSYDELRRLGLPEEIENQFRKRNPEGTGLLVIARAISEGPGYEAGMAAGDVLVECFEDSFGRRTIDNFHSLAEIIDESVGKQVTFTLYRAEQRKDITVTVQDIYSITPNTFVEVGGAVLHPLSYQLAKYAFLPCKGLYAASSGIFRDVGTTGEFLITQLEGKPVDSLESFLKIYLSIEDGKKVEFKYLRLLGFDEQSGIVEIDHHFFACAQYTLNKSWKRVVLSPNPQSIAEHKRLQRAPTLLLGGTRVENLKQILVMIHCHVPYKVDDVKVLGTHTGVGVLVATKPRPMIITSRASVPTTISDISIIIGKRSLTAHVLYYGLIVVLAVDASRIPPLLYVPKISDKEYKVGDSVEVFGLNDEHQLVQRRTEISAISAVVCERTYSFWHVVNTEGYSLLDSPKTLGGILIDPENDSLVALWMEIGENSYSGVDYRYYIYPIIESLKAGEDVKMWSPGLEFEYILLAKAMDLGMPEHHAARIDNIAKDIGSGAQVVRVSQNLRHSTTGLNVGDFILEVEEETVGRMADIRQLFQAETSSVLVLRNREEMEVQVQAKPVNSQGISRIICWAGAILQQSPDSALDLTTLEFVRAIEKEEVANPEDLVYISSLFEGSPGDCVLYPSTWILEIAEHKVRKLDDLVDIFTSLKGRGDSEEYIRVKMLMVMGHIHIVGVKLNPQFWPAWILERKQDKWIRTELE